MLQNVATFECQEVLWVVTLMISEADTSLGHRSSQRKEKLTSQILPLRQPEYNKFLFILPIVPNVHFLASLYVTIWCTRDTHKLLYFQQMHMAAEECLEIVKKIIIIFLLNLYVCR